MASFSTENIARASTHHPWLTIGIWVLVIVGAIGAAGAFLGDALTTDQELLADVEAKRGDDALGRGFGRERMESGLNPDGENETIVIQSDSLTVDDPAFRAVVEEVTAEIRALGQPDVAAVISFYETGDESLVSEDRRTTIVPVITGPEDTVESAERIMEILHEHDGVDGFVLATGGQGSIDVTFNETAEKDLQEGEFQIGLPAAMLIVVIVFGALVASILPLAVAIVSIIMAIGLTALVGQRFDISIF
ncbi:MAG TPA: MMPL family transporter, partial [Tepidiformaceae bacterium]|nr:MMPL family transporter [Tepidiformaceae bacterium]